MPRRVLAVLAVILAAWPTGLASAGGPAAGIAATGPAPAVATELVDGRPFRLGALRGRWVVLTFFASRSASCRARLPVIVETARGFRARGLELVLVSMDTDRDELRHYLQVEGIDVPVCFDGRSFRGPVARAYALRGIPWSYLVDPSGEMVVSGLAEADLAVALEAAVTPGPPGESDRARIERVRRARAKPAVVSPALLCVIAGAGLLIWRFGNRRGGPARTGSPTGSEVPLS